MENKNPWEGASEKMDQVARCHSLIILASSTYAQGADAGLFSSLAVLAGCVGAGIAMPASLF